MYSKTQNSTYFIAIGLFLRLVRCDPDSLDKDNETELVFKVVCDAARMSVRFRQRSGSGGLQ